MTNASEVKSIVTGRASVCASGTEEHQAGGVAEIWRLVQIRCKFRRFV